MTEKTKEMKLVYTWPESLSQQKTHYCPGCGHGIIHKLLASAIDDLGVREESVVISPVGCSVFVYYYIKADGIESAHGRAHAVATGLKRALPEKIIIAYQGDGDLLAIGTGETIHAANRGENITVIFVNNAIYGMTGGQMAPTSMVGQKTQTSPYGRQAEDTGHPIRACEMLNTLEAPVFIERCAVNNVKNITRAKKAIKKALTNQVENRGYSFVEVLSMCPTNWGMTSRDAADWVENVMIPYYPLKNFRDN